MRSNPAGWITPRNRKEVTGLSWASWRRKWNVSTCGWRTSGFANHALMLMSITSRIVRMLRPSWPRPSVKTFHITFTWNHVKVQVISGPNFFLFQFEIKTRTCEQRTCSLSSPDHVKPSLIGFGDTSRDWLLLGRRGSGALELLAATITLTVSAFRNQIF